jgi:hypothetical protein
MPRAETCASEPNRPVPSLQSLIGRAVTNHLARSAAVDARVMMGVARTYDWEPTGWRFLIEARCPGVSVHPRVRDQIAKRFMDRIPSVSARPDRLYLGCLLDSTTKDAAVAESRQITSTVLRMAGLTTDHITDSCLYNLEETMAEPEPAMAQNVFSLADLRGPR